MVKLTALVLSLTVALAATATSVAQFAAASALGAAGIHGGAAGAGGGAVKNGLYTGAFVDSKLWVKDHETVVDRNKMVTFTVAFNLRNVKEMHDEFLAVSMPSSYRYGQYLSLEEISDRFGPTRQDREAVVQFFESIHGARVDGLNHKGDMITVTAPVHAIEQRLGTKLSYRRNKQALTSKKALRSDEPLSIPEDIQHLISFVSLNSPVTHVYPRAGSAMKPQEELLRRGTRSLEDDPDEDAATQQTIGVTQGNTEALLSFVAYCGDGTRNQASPPCSNLPSAAAPTGFSVSVTAHNNDVNNAYQLDASPLSFDVSSESVYCYNSYSHDECNGFAGNNCTCLMKVSPLPKYKQLKATVAYTLKKDKSESTIVSAVAATQTVVLGSSSFFVLTDVATASMLNDLYSIPAGMTAHHGSNQSVVEFYSEFYSNSDLKSFFSLSGLPAATIPERNVLGDLANDESNPGGEAQLDVEYIMALAPNADTYFYSFSDLNPNSPGDEGFLAYLTYVGAERNPPLVHSLSYGDVESEIFGTDSTSPDPTYGSRCDLEFLKLGLRGVSVIFSSGDDGIGNFLIREDPETACAKAYPAWPASSPYVTSVGATQLTDAHLPACGTPYSYSASYGPNVPDSSKLLFECSGVRETVCSSTIGGVITSGGGFSDVFDRASLAPWQDALVSNYVSSSSAVPPLDYFTSTGRGYPDVATYGSNYFVFLAGK
jgi:subtilase family serine protease